MYLKGKSLGLGGAFLKRCSAVAVFLLCANSVFASDMRPGVLFDLGGFPITNTMLTMAVFSLLFILFVRFILLRGGVKTVPSKGQMLFEAMVENFGGIFEMILGKKAVKAVTPFLLCVFVYILAMNWSGLFPGVGSIGWTESAQISSADASKYTAEGFHVNNENGVLTAERFVPFVRPANTDLNMTVALALISFFLFFYFVRKYAGFGYLLKDWFGNKADKNEVPLAMYYGLAPIFFAVGFIELISAFIRPVSLSFRLFGNVFSGEMLLDKMHSMAWASDSFITIFSWVLPLPFYFLELLVGLIQAFVFTLLSAIYIGLIVNHDGASH